MAEALLSVIIPTYNRYQYLKDCITATSNVKSELLEIVIQDNTEDNTEIMEFIKEIHDSRLKYFHRKDHISVVDNCDAAVEHSTGKYVCMIGDDDTICSSMLTATKYCIDNEIDAMMALLPGFNWPDMTFSGNKEPNLFFEDRANGSIRMIDSKKVLERVVTSAEGLPLELPRVYHGVISRECLNRVKKKTGTYFPGPSPDMANSAAVSLEAKKVILISDYLMVSGYGYQSARGEGNRKQHYGKINEKPWLPKDTEEKWNKDIPKIFSGETIFAQSLTLSLKNMGREDLAKRYNYGALYAMFLAHHRDTLGYMIGFFLRKPIRLIWFVKGILRRNKDRKEYFKNQKKDRYYHQVANISNLIDAQEYTEKLRSGIKEYHVVSE